MSSPVDHQGSGYTSIEPLYSPKGQNDHAVDGLQDSVGGNCVWLMAIDNKMMTYDKIVPSTRFVE